MWLWLNDKLIPENEALLPATASGTLSGRGVFSTLGIVARRPLWPARHFARLSHDAAILGLDIPFDEAEFEPILRVMIGANNIESGVARVTLTARGEGRWNLSSGADCSIVARSSLIARTPMRLWLSPYFVDARRPECGLKSTSYQTYTALWHQAQSRGYDEALVRESSGALCEAARHNLFWLRDGVLKTPGLQSGCLPGIGRALIMEWAEEQNLPNEQGLFSVDELFQAEEIFLTNAVSGPRAVTEIFVQDETFVLPVGPVTKGLQDKWDREVERI